VALESAQLEGETDSWGELNARPDANPLINLLEAMGVLPGNVMARRAFFDELEIGPDQSVLDVGCGPATALPDLLELNQNRGYISGIDPTLAFIEYARQKAARLGAAQARYEVGDARKLEIASGSVDVAFCDKVLLHVGPAEAILSEMLRVVRPGGRLGAMEYDCDSWILNGRDVGLTRRVIEANRDEQYDGFMGRKLPGLFHRLGLGEVKVGHFAAYTDSLKTSPYWWECLNIMSQRAVKQGVFDEIARTAWLAEQAELSEQGDFWLCIGGTWAVGRKLQEQE